MTFFGEIEARYAALAGLVHDVRVLDLTEHGDGRCIDALVTAGARSVTVCAPESVREHLTTQSAELTLTESIGLPLPFDAGSFDVVICFDLVSRMVRDSTWATALREVLEPEGAVVISSVSAEDATRVLGPTFGAATVFAQTPLVGHMLYDTEADELEPELDRTWADSDADEPTRYVVVFAPDKRHSEKLTLVQMPFGKWEAAARDELTRLKSERDDAVRERDNATHERDGAIHDLTMLREEVATSQWQAGTQSDELEAARVEAQNARHEVELLMGEMAALRSELDAGRAGGDSSALADELERHRNDRASLEAQIADLLQESGAFSEHRMEWQARLDSVEGELVAERARVAELTAQTVSSAAGNAELEERLSREAQRSVGLDHEVAAERVRQSELEAALADARERLAELQSRLDDADQSRASESSEALARASESEERLRQERDIALADLSDAIRSRDEANERADRLTEARDSSAARASELHHERDRVNARAEEAAREFAELSAKMDVMLAERDAAASRADDVVQRFEAARQRAEDYQRAVDHERQAGDEVRRGLESERQRSDELRRAADDDRERIVELTRALDDERAKRRDLEARNAQAAEAEELLSRARLETVEAVEALRQERVRGEQLLTRLVDLEQRLTPRAKKPPEESRVSASPDGETAAPEKTIVTRDALPPGQDAIDGKS